MRLPFAFRLAWREGRGAGRRRLALYVTTIALGVAALVAIESLRRDLLGSLEAQGEELLGADIELRSNRPFPARVEALLDSAGAAGASISRVTTLASMATAPPEGMAVFVQVSAVAGEFPAYGAVETDPPGRWEALQHEEGGGGKGGRDGGSGRDAGAVTRVALLDPTLLLRLGAHVGDTLTLGEGRFRIAGTVTRLLAGSRGIGTFGPPVYVSGPGLAETGLLTTGSLVRYRAYIRLPAAVSPASFEQRHRRILRAEAVGVATVKDKVESLTLAMNRFVRFLGLVGLTALLLGGVGVANAAHLFVRSRFPTVAVLRCLGATRRAVFAAYLAQAALLGAGGAIIGAVGGILLRALIPGLLPVALPIGLTFAVHWGAVLAGLAVGVWVSVAFALLPLLQIRHVPPLAALRIGFEPPPDRPDVARLATCMLLAAGVAGLCVWQLSAVRAGLWVALALALAAAALWATAWSLVRATHRFFPGRARYVVRQGVANLFRPRNQTVTVTMTVGFGVFLFGTISVVQRNLLDLFQRDREAARPNLVLFDVQPAQRNGVADILRRHGVTASSIVPIVPARLSRLDGRKVAELRNDSSAAHRPPAWTLRHEYRNTYRASLTESERLVAGRWWSAPRKVGSLPRISMEDELAERLGLGVGDRVTWNVAGTEIETRVANLRRVEWARLEPNFFVVFEPGVLEEAPQSLAALARVPSDEASAAVQSDVVRRYANVTAIDLGTVQETVEGILGRVALAVRFMAFFVLSAATVVLVGAIAASRAQRLRESVLLRTLGASSRQVIQVLFTEYAVLGALAGLTGVLLAGAAGWAVIAFFFRLPYHLPAVDLFLMWGATAALTPLVGFAGSRGVLRRSPLAVLRALGE